MKDLEKENNLNSINIFLFIIILNTIFIFIFLIKCELIYINLY